MRSREDIIKAILILIGGMFLFVFAIAPFIWMIFISFTHNPFFLYDVDEQKVDVSNLTAQIENQAVELNWDDPTEDFDKLEIKYDPIKVPDKLTGNEVTNLLARRTGFGYSLILEWNDPKNINFKEIELSYTPVKARDKIIPKVVFPDETNSNKSFKDLKANVGKRLITIKWLEPKDENFDGVEIIQDPGNLIYKINKGKLNKEIIRDNLNTIYTFTVKRINKDGTKSKGQIIKAPFRAEVSTFTADVSNGKAILKWNDPSDDDFEKVNVIYHAEKCEIFAESLEVNKGIEFVEIDGLKKDTKYIFYIKRMNKDKTRSKGLKVISPEIKIIAKGQEQSPKIIGITGDITHTFTLKVIDNNGNKSAGLQIKAPMIVQVPKGTEKQLFTNLINNEKHSFVVRRVDLVGNKTEGKEITATPKFINNDLPKIENLKSKIEDSEVSFVWNNPDKNKYDTIEITQTPVVVPDKQENVPRQLQNKEDETPPPEVKELMANLENTYIYLKWDSPIVEDFKNVEITHEPASTPSKPIIVMRGKQDTKIHGIDKEKVYTITIKTIDENGNKSAGHKITIPRKIIVNKDEEKIKIKKLENNLKYTFTFKTIDENGNKSAGINICATPKPSFFTLRNYISILTDDKIFFPFYFRNSIIVSIIVSLIVTFIASLSGYAVSRLRFPGRIAIPLFVLAMSMFPQISIIGYLLNFFSRPFGFESLKATNTYIALVLPYMAWNVPIALWINMSYFAQIPSDLDKAALVDGAGRFKTLFRVILPIALPGLFSSFLLVFISCFNEFMFALMLTTDKGAQTLPVGIAFFEGTFGQTAWSQIMAASALASVPLVIMTLIFQRYVVQGLAGGAVKG